MSASPAEPVSPAGEQAELERLRSEVAELRARLASVPAPPVARGRRMLLARKIIAVVLAALAAFGAVASVIGIWGARTTLNTERWTATVAPLPHRPEAGAAMAAYLTAQVFDKLDVQRRLS